jgi:hypothetical protein
MCTRHVQELAANLSEQLINCRQCLLPLTNDESNDFMCTAQSIVFICDVDSAFHVHEAFTSLWILKGTTTGRVFFF